MTPYHHALHQCAERYRDMQLEREVPKTDPLWLFTMELMFKSRDGYPVPKLCRWLGYIQGILIERGYTTVEAERDWTRPLFRPLDFPADGVAVAWPTDALFGPGDLVQKKGRASWRGRIVGWYRTDLTALGYAVESVFEPGSVQIYPATALLAWDGDTETRPVGVAG